MPTAQVNDTSGRSRTLQIQNAASWTAPLITQDPETPKCVFGAAGDHLKRCDFGFPVSDFGEIGPGMTQHIDTDVVVVPGLNRVPGARVLLAAIFRG